MLAAPSAAIDLPLKILVAEDARGGVWVAYNSPQYLKVRHGLPENLLANIAVASGRFRRASSRSPIGLIQGCEPRASCRGLDNTPRPTGAQCYGEHKYS